MKTHSLNYLLAMCLLFFSVGAVADTTPGVSIPQTEEEKQTRKVITTYKKVGNAVAKKNGINISFGKGYSGLKGAATILEKLSSFLDDAICDYRNFKTEDTCYNVPDFESDAVCVINRKFDRFTYFGVSFSGIEGNDTDIYELSNGQEVCFDQEGLIRLYKRTSFRDFKEMAKVVVNNETKGKSVTMAGTWAKQRYYLLEPYEGEIDRVVELKLLEGGTYGLPQDRALTPEEEEIARVTTKRVNREQFYNSTFNDDELLREAVYARLDDSWQLQGGIALSNEAWIKSSFVNRGNEFPICIPSNFDTDEISGVGLVVEGVCKASEFETDVWYPTQLPWLVEDYLVLSNKNISGWNLYQSGEADRMVKAPFEDGLMYPICRNADYSQRAYGGLGFVVEGQCVRSRWWFKHKVIPSYLNSYQVLYYDEPHLAAITEANMVERNDLLINRLSLPEQLDDVNDAFSQEEFGIWRNHAVLGAAYVSIPFYIDFGGTIGQFYGPICQDHGFIGTLVDGGCRNLQNASNGVGVVTNSDSMKVLSLPGRRLDWVPVALDFDSFEYVSEQVDFTNESFIIPHSQGNSSAEADGICRDPATGETGIVRVALSFLPQENPDGEGLFLFNDRYSKTKPVSQCVVTRQDGRAELFRPDGTTDYLFDYEVLTAHFEGPFGDMINRMFNIDSAYMMRHAGTCQIALSHIEEGAGVEQTEIVAVNLQHINRCAELANLYESAGSSQAWAALFNDNSALGVNLVEKFQLEGSYQQDLAPLFTGHANNARLKSITWKYNADSGIFHRLPVQAIERNAVTQRF